MYSYEIENLMKCKQYLLDIKEYFYVCDTSPQIARIKYNSYCDDFEMWTYDQYYWKFKVRRIEYGKNKKNK